VNRAALVVLCGLAALSLGRLVVTIADAQSTQIDLGTQARGFYAIPHGALANMPARCQLGWQYMALDQPLGQQLYLCSLNPTETWMQQLNLGGSGALEVVGGSLDVNLAIVPIDFGGIAPAPAH
jgi:hypothetical protein